MDGIAYDPSYNGVNLLKNNPSHFTAGADELTVKFNERTEPQAVNQLIISGLQGRRLPLRCSARPRSLPDRPAAHLVWGQTGSAAITAINAAITAIDSALVTLRQSAQAFGTNASLLEIRSDFTDQLVNTLKGGASNLVNADMNEESANLLSLQTRQQLGTISLSIAQKSEEAILRLF